MNLDLSLERTLPVTTDVNQPRRELLTPLPEPGHFLLVLDNSSAEKIKRCHTAGTFYLFFAREAHARTAALGFGGAIHLGLECIERNVDEVTTATKVINYFSDNPQPPDEYRTPQTALEVLAHYRERRTFPDYHWRVLDDTTGPIIERPFELPLGVLEVGADIQLPSWDTPRRVDYIHVAWSGRIDLCAEANGFARVVDHKTTSIAGDQFVQSFQLASQTLGYVWAGRQLWPDLDIRGFCLNAIHLKKPANGVGLLDKGPRGGPPALNFFRSYFEYSPGRLDQWAKHALIFVEDWIHSLVRVAEGGFEELPLNDHGCFNKFGQCPYWDVCTIDDINVRLRMLNSDAYKNVTWNPTHK